MEIVSPGLWNPRNRPGRWARAREEGGLFPGPAGGRWSSARSALPTFLNDPGWPALCRLKGLREHAPIFPIPAQPPKLSAHPCAFDTFTPTATWQGMKPHYSVCVLISAAV